MSVSSSKDIYSSSSSSKQKNFLYDETENSESEESLMDENTGSR